LSALPGVSAKVGFVAKGLHAKIVSIVLLATSALTASGQAGAPTAPGKRFDWMIGEWQGDFKETYSHYSENVKATWKIERDQALFLKLTYVGQEVGPDE
jgi:hypothetical protein